MLFMRVRVCVRITQVIWNCQHFLNYFHYTLFIVMDIIYCSKYNVNFKFIILIGLVCIVLCVSLYPLQILFSGL